MAAYATTADLTNYLAAGTEIPADADRLLLRASELLDEVTLDRIDTTDADQAEAAKNAACAQVEFWLADDEDRDVTGPVASLRLGSLSVDYGGLGGQSSGERVAPTYLAPRAKRYLFRAGLLSRGVAMM